MATKKKQAEEAEVLEVMEETELPEMMEEEGFEEEYDESQLFDADGNELLFPDGPAINKVEEWKSQHGEVFLTEFEEDVFLWKTLNRKEYKQIMKAQGADQFYKEERICEACVVYPDRYNFMAMAQGKAGIPTLLSELIMEKSGFQAKTGAMRL